MILGEGLAEGVLDAGRTELEQWSLKVMQQVADLRPPDGLVPIMISPESGTFTSHIVSLGARGDSYYEYLLKTWILLGKPPDHFLLKYVPQHVFSPSCPTVLQGMDAQAPCLSQ